MDKITLNSIQNLTVTELAQAIVKASKEQETEQQSLDGVPTTQILEQLKVAITELERRYQPNKESFVSLRSLPIGSKVVDPKTTYYGEPITWLVAAKDHYLDNSTTLLAQNILTFKPFDAKEPSSPDEWRKDYGNNEYFLSNIHQWLNASGDNWFTPSHEYDAPPTEANVSRNSYAEEAGFLTNFSEAFLNALYEFEGAGVFLLSRKEVGLGKEDGCTEGSLLELFKDEKHLLAYPTKACTVNDNEGDPEESDWWWLRTPSASYSYVARSVHSSGALVNLIAYGGYGGVRPALNLLSSIAVKAVPNDDGIYEIVW